jgi:hypothetical protein
LTEFSTVVFVIKDGSYKMVLMKTLSLTNTHGQARGVAET